MSYYSKESDVRIVTDVVKEYPHMIRIYIYHNSFPINPTPKMIASRKKDEPDDVDIVRSIRRTRTTIYDLILSNKFDYWCTFTFSAKVGDRFDEKYCRHTMMVWLRNQRRHSPNLKYLVVPEYHKRCEDCVNAKVKTCIHSDRPKAVHFHALIANFNGALRLTKLRTKAGQKVYNATGYRSGFTKFVELYDTENPEKLANYMTKYITKGMPKFGGKKRYWVSQNLIRPKSTVNGIFTFRLEKLIWNRMPKYVTNDFEVMEIPKTSSIALTRDVQGHLLDVSPTASTDEKKRLAAMRKRSREGVDIFAHSPSVCTSISR